MPRKQNFDTSASMFLTSNEWAYTESHIANFALPRILQTRYISNLQGRIVPEEYLWGILDCSSACVDELLMGNI